MVKPGPIIVVEDDDDDKEILESIFVQLDTPHPRVYFENCTVALAYLLALKEQPFLILSDINLPGMSGPEFKTQINDNELLRKKSVPFVFLSTAAERYGVEKAYETMVQGYFIKPFKPAELTRLISVMLEYWNLCVHPNNPVS